MGQHFRHDDNQTTDAGGEIYSAICQCRDMNIPDKKIIEAMIAELYGMSHIINDDAQPFDTMKELDNLCDVST